MSFGAFGVGATAGRLGIALAGPGGGSDRPRGSRLVVLTLDPAPHEFDRHLHLRPGEHVAQARAVAEEFGGDGGKEQLNPGHSTVAPLTELYRGWAGTRVLRR